MGIGIIGIIAAVVLIVILAKIIKFGLKMALLTIFTVVAALTVWICFSQPPMHEPFSVNTIEYLLKFNKDGSVTTTKQVTETVVTEGTK